MAPVSAGRPPLATFAGTITGIEVAQLAVLPAVFLGLRHGRGERHQRLVASPAAIAIALFGVAGLAEDLVL